MGGGCERVVTSEGQVQKQTKTSTFVAYLVVELELRVRHEDGNRLLVATDVLRKID